MKMRQLLRDLIDRAEVEMDTKAMIRVVRRDSHGLVTHVGIAPVSYLYSANQIAIEEPEIEWREKERNE